MMRYLLVLISLVTLLACTDRDDDVNAPHLRIRNMAGFTYEQVLIGDQEIPFENISPDTYSAYLEFETAYSQPFVEIRAGDESYVLQAVDPAGAQVLPPGFYTYELQVSESGELILNFKVD